MKISLFSKVILDHPLEDAMRLAAEVGYEGIELIGRSPHLAADIDLDRLREVKELATQLKLPIVNIPSYIGQYGQVRRRRRGGSRNSSDSSRSRISSAVAMCATFLPQSPLIRRQTRIGSWRWNGSAGWLTTPPDMGSTWC